MESYDITKDTGILSCQQTWFCGKPPSRGGFNHENIMILQQACHPAIWINISWHSTGSTARTGAL